MKFMNMVEKITTEAIIVFVTRLCSQQEYIPVGCVPPASVTVSTGVWEGCFWVGGVSTLLSVHPISKFAGVDYQRN